MERELGFVKPDAFGRPKSQFGRKAVLAELAYHINNHRLDIWN